MALPPLPSSPLLSPSPSLSPSHSPAHCPRYTPHLLSPVSDLALNLATLAAVATASPATSPPPTTTTTTTTMTLDPAAHHSYEHHSHNHHKSHLHSNQDYDHNHSPPLIDHNDHTDADNHPDDTHLPSHRHFDPRFHPQPMDGVTKTDPKSCSPSASQAGDDILSDDDQLDEDDDDDNDDSQATTKDEGTIAINQDGFQSVHFSAGGKPVKVRSMFVDKLFRMVEDSSIQNLISWAKEGDMFYVHNCIKLSDAVLPKFFKHNNWQSFVRQLNMYGFHKIYRYDREESNMNRKNPETQRWQFYHPHFQRDFPQLRKNIKRKSARSMNTAPATSRVIFEHGKGYFLQRNDRSRSNSGETSHSQALSHIRPSEMRPTPPTPSPSSQIQPISPHLQRQSPPVPRHATQSSPTISSGPASSHEQRDRPHMPYPSDSTRPGAYQRQSYDGNADSSHDASFARPPPPPSPFIGSDAQGYRSNRTISGNGYNGPESSRDGPARHFSVIDHRKSSTQSGGSDHSSPLVRPQEAPSHPSRSHGSMTESFHDSHRTADRPHSMGERGPVPKDASQPTPTLPAGNKFNTPPTPAIPSPSSASSSFPPTGHSQQQPQQPGRAIGSPKSPQHADRFSPLNAKELESRLHFVEDAYMALRQYAQKLEQVQASQDRSLQWMREKIDQLTDAAQMRRDSVASPLTPQSGVISTTKRKADPIPDDPRSRSRFDTSAPSSSSRHDSTDIPMGEHRESYYTHSHHPSRGSGVFEGSSSSSGYHHSSSDPHYHDGPAAAHHHHHPSATHLHPSSSHHPHSQSQGLQSHQYRPPTTQGKVY